MKKSLVIGGIVLVCLAGGGVVLTNVLESKTEQAVRDALGQTKTTAETVSYSLWQNRLDVTGIKFDLEFSGQKMKGRVDSVALSGFDPDCLNPEVKNLPRVAETLEMKGLAWDTTVGEPGSAVSSTMTSSLQEVRMEDWYQNLGRLLKLDWESEAFWAEVYRYKLAMTSSKNYTTTVSIHDSPTPFTEHIAMMGLLGPVDAENPGDLGGRKLSFFVNDLTMEMPDMAKVKVARTEMRDVVMPAPADMVALLALSKQTMAQPDDSKLALQLVEQMSKTYENVSPIRTILMQGMSIDEMRGVPAIRMQEMEQTLEIGTPVRVGLRLVGLNIAATKEQLALLAPMDAFLPQGDGVTTDAAIMLSLNPEAVGGSRLDWSTNAFGLADAKGSMDFVLSVSSLKDLFSPSVRLDKVFKFKETTLDYKDNGLVAAAVATYGKQSGLSPLDAQQVALGQVPFVAGQFGEQGIALAQALNIMLETPGKLTASLAVAKPASIEQVMLMLLLEPQSVTLKAQAEPGKPFADWLPASLKAE